MNSFDMKTILFLFGSAASAVYAYLCGHIARRCAASGAYALRFSQDSVEMKFAHDAARAYYFWAGLMLSSVIVAGVLLFAGLRSRRGSTRI